MPHQHSHKWPACPECCYRGSVEPCADCRDGAGASPAPTRATIDATVLRVAGRYLGRPVTLDQTMADLGLSQLDAMQAMLDLEDEYEAQGLILLGRVSWSSLRDLADQVALGVLPGESGEVVDHAAWADDTLAACAEARHPLAAPDVPVGQRWTNPDHRSIAEIEGVSEQELELSRAACIDGLRPRKGEVVYSEIIHPPARIKD